MGSATAVTLKDVSGADVTHKAESNVDGIAKG